MIWQPKPLRTRFGRFYSRQRTSQSTIRATCIPNFSAKKMPDSDGSTTVYFGPSKPAGLNDGNWIQTMPGKRWFTVLRFYSPKEPFFDKIWRPGEIELQSKVSAADRH